MSGTVQSVDVTISAIDVASSIITVNSRAAAIGSIGGEAIRAEIINSTTIRFSLGTPYSMTANKVANYQVIEFNGVKSRQVLNVTMSASTVNTTITAVTMGKTIINLCGIFTAVSSVAMGSSELVSAVLTSTTQVTCTGVPLTSPHVILSLEVIEFY